jgi:hypothetical protein
VSEERVEKLEKSLQHLRKRVDQVDRRQGDVLDGLRYAVLACAVAGALLAMTAAAWRTVGGGDDADGYVETLWGMVPEGWQAAWTLGGVLVVGVGTIAVFVADTAGKASHIVFVVLALLTAVGIVLVGAVDASGFYSADEADSAPARWLSLLAVLFLAVVHGTRANDVRR